MEKNLILLFGCTVLKIVALSLLGYFLINKWKRQSKKYYTDFPFLMSITFFGYALAKIYDLCLYYIFRDTPDLELLTEFDPTLLIIVKIRFVLCPVLVIAPYLVLMMMIWFQDRVRTQKIIGVSWIILSLLSIIVVQNYSQILIVNALVAFPIILLSIISFFVLNHQKKLHEINSLVLAIAWSLYVCTQLLRPLWITLGSGTWGLTWVGELVELLTLVMIGIGFIIPANYRKIQGTNLMKTAVY
ncbi:hypothetical protein NEF87_004995 [Candidatus Lokiarchaeum ossiferum]|uniref:Uncharacterized protein n=1 Tax=Candidatus Lokiarchaeum ossiferum TaxID=2951803 RepID=A0ABY6HZ53_9ARCH|nr:hypothetical protein NEF87_004995 [Candidatus Lokiarchaeum sp. B-35]